MKSLFVFVLISASVSLVFGQYYMSSPIYAGGFGASQFGGSPWGGGGFNSFGGYPGGFGNFGYQGGFNSFGSSGLYNQGYYDDPVQPIILDSGSGRGFGGGGGFGGISGRDLFAGATGFAVGSLLERRRNAG